MVKQRRNIFTRVLWEFLHSAQFLWSPRSGRMAHLEHAGTKQEIWKHFSCSPEERALQALCTPTQFRHACLLRVLEKLKEMEFKGDPIWYCFRGIFAENCLGQYPSTLGSTQLQTQSCRNPSLWSPRFRTELDNFPAVFRCHKHCFSVDYSHLQCSEP